MASFSLCIRHEQSCPRCGYDGGALHSSTLQCPKCGADWIWIQPNPYICRTCDFNEVMGKEWVNKD